MTASKREPIVYDGIEIDPDWLDAQIAHYVPGCMDEGVRLMRAFDRSRRRATESKAAAA